MYIFIIVPRFIHRPRSFDDYNDVLWVVLFKVAFYGLATNEDNDNDNDKDVEVYYFVTELCDTSLDTLLYAKAKAKEERNHKNSNKSKSGTSIGGASAGGGWCDFDWNRWAMLLQIASGMQYLVITHIYA